MKNSLIIILSICTLFLISIHASAQDEQKDDQVKSIFSAGSELKGFGSFDMKFTPIAGNNSLLIGASGGVTVNKYLILGLGGYGIATKTTIENTFNPNDKLRMYGGYGGLILGFNIFPREVVHISIPILLGAGAAEITNNLTFPNINNEEFTLERSSFFVAEPMFLIELNVTRFFRVDIGGGYRFVQGTSMNNLKDEDLTNWTGMVGLKFGSF